MTTFGPPLDLAATYGPGKQVAVCETCFVPVLLDDLEGHRDWNHGLVGVVAVMCRMCDRPAETSIVYTIPTNSLDPRVVHSTCEKHTAGLKRDMVRAGWTATEVTSL